MKAVPFVRVLRAGRLESEHAGVAVVANARGEVIAGWGDADTVAFPRSSLKPFQAVAFVESGAADAFGLDDRHLALATASHRGEPVHVDLVKGWLRQLGLGEDDLSCGPDLPLDRQAAEEIVAGGGRRSRVFHNCSGKHCGFLSLARHRGLPTAGYNEIGHPCQQTFLDVFSDFLGFDARKLPAGRDGCTLPALALPLADMARALARFAAARAETPARGDAVRRIQAAMRARPELVSGSRDNLPRLVAATGGRVLAKTGAEGYLAAFVPDQGLGIALKIADGNARASYPALLAVLRSMRLLSDAEASGLADLAAPPVTDSTGLEVGRIEAVEGF